MKTFIKYSILIIPFLISCNNYVSFSNKLLGIKIPSYKKLDIISDDCFLADCDIKLIYYFNEKEFKILINSVKNSFMFNSYSRYKFNNLSIDQKNDISMKLIENNLTGYWREEVNIIRFKTLYDHNNIRFNRIFPKNYKLILSSPVQLFNLEAIIYFEHRTLYIEYFSY